ncbi:hypothetical protein J2T10_000085 [Paenarthrobacter nicotinovorans]|uniref:Uncharacterized protein n=1 Tax=Paenarthrobacter nicotinovorans TaxID=29320 RepID=A0ABT9THD6_PAENI|nr:hypothetical protein [Paenarthrobacter nicotinovorans]MDQ0100466.1 hypothetical protein [Paenarthrobacter nicotinovorans]
MNLPDEAVEAAAKAAAKDEDASNWHDESEHYRNGWRNRMQVGMTAAAPFIAAQAWDEGADSQFQRSVMKRQTDGNPYRSEQ